jgi:hypothetical protein
MKRIRIVGLCLLAAFATTALAASAAQAAGPEYFSCVKAAKVGKTYTGQYSAKTCAMSGLKVDGKYERASAVGITYTSKTKTATLTTPGLGKVVCRKATGVGTIVSATEDEDVVTFHDCETLGKSCHSLEPTVEPAGTIVTFPLMTKLGLIAPGEVGVDYYGLPLIAYFLCGEEVLITDSGSVIGVITSPLEAAYKKAATDFAGNGLEQVPTKFEGEEEDTLVTKIEGVGTFSSIEETESSQKNGAELGVTE